MHDARTRWMIPVLMTGAFLGSLSQNMLTSALPAILTEFRISALVGQWLTTVYLLILGVITVLTADLFQRVRTRLLLEASLLLFAAGCALSLFAPSFPVLLLSRAVQACGAGVLIPVLQMVLIHLCPPDRQGQALGLSGIVIGFAPAVGPALSGLLVDSLGWRSIFFLLAAASLAVAAAGFFTFAQVGDPRRPPLRMGSALLYGAGFTLGMIGVTELGAPGPMRLTGPVLLAAGAAVLAGFVRYERKAASPLLRLSLFRHRAMRVGTALMVLTYTIMSAGTLLVPLYIQSLCGHSATLSGLALLPGSVLLAFLSPAAGRLADHYGVRRVMAAGLVLLAAGMGPFALVSAGTPLPLTALLYSVGHIGLAFLLMPITAYAISGLSLDDADHGMAILNSLRQIGGSLCATLLILAASAVSAGGGFDLTGFRLFGLLSAAAALLSLVFWLRMKQDRP